MYYTYIIYSQKLGKYYIGSTEDLKRRISEHNAGNANFTSRGGHWALAYYSAFTNKTDATAEEMFLKTGQGRERRKFLLKNYIGEVPERSKGAPC